jgi:hypothetical protein
LTSREFQRAARQRLTTAEFLLSQQYNLDAMYLAGYSIECTLKALILKLAAKLSPTQKIGSRQIGRTEIERQIESGSKMHNPEVLAEFLKDLGQPIPLEIKKKFRRSQWSTSLRYESGRKDTGEVRWFLRLALQTYEWVEGHL